MLCYIYTLQTELGARFFFTFARALVCRKYGQGSFFARALSCERS